MELKFAEAVQKRVLLTDGALGTEIYSRGFFVNSCYEELCLSQPLVVQEIHAQFAKAGAEVLRTNTFSANRLSLQVSGLGDKVEAINRKAVELARKAAGDTIYVAGSVGPISAVHPPEASGEAFREQIGVLLDAGVDVLYLESFSGLEQLKQAYEIAVSLAGPVPVVPFVSYWLFSLSGAPCPCEVVKRIKEWGTPYLAFSDGDPVETLDALPDIMAAAGEMKIAVMPGAGLPKVVEGRTLCMASPEYMAEYTRRYVQKGASIIGGSYGITPAMVREMRSFLRSVQPGMAAVVEVISDNGKAEEILEPIPLEERSPFGKVLQTKFGVSVELDPPKGVDATKSVEGAKFLYEHGIDAVNIADGPRATGRMSPIALALLVRQAVPMEAIVHVCCRDRNLLAIQMDLISANALGLRNMMLITGDPPKMGIYPDSTAVFDLDAVGLVQSANLLNHGLDFAKRSLKGQTSLLLGVGCNPGAPDLDREVRRYEEKINAGAEFVFSQPVYDPELLERFLSRIKHVKPIPFYVGILPLASAKNADFLHNQVPGMQIPEETRQRMHKAPTKEAQQQEGIYIAVEALKHARTFPQIRGAYIFPPFGKYERILDVLEMAGV